MKKFSFSLQRLLNYTEQVLNVERASLANMNAVLRGFLNELEEMKAERVRRMREFAEKNAEGTTPFEMERNRNFMTSLDEEIFNKEVQIDMQRKVISKQEDKVRETKIEISTMEKLRENKLEEYNYLDQKEQELFIEEFISSKNAMQVN